jgi:plasmid stabilization system protein ParE
MVSDYHILPAAREEFDEALQYHESREEGLAALLFTRVINAIERIAGNPRMYARFRKQYRVAKVRRHRYVIVYTYRPKLDLVLIHAIFHTSRNWAELYTRLR